jgi:hypothetical protein
MTDLLQRLYHHLVHRAPLLTCKKCDRVWAALLADDGFRERLDKSIKDVDEGRWYHYDRGVMTPNPDWPEDGEQPREPK